MPQVSVIVPVYKTESYLHRCVDSILAQSFTDFEIILVDDGSPDNCGRICDEYAEKDERIKVIHQENGGLSAARNAGLNRVQGDVVYFLDSDDYIEAGLFEAAVDAMQTYDLVVIDYRIVDENGVEKSRCCFDEKEIVFFDEYSRFRFLACEYLNYKVGFEACVHFYKKKIIDKHSLYFEDNRKVFAEDLLFTFCYLMHTDSIACLNGVYYNYCQHADSIMGIQKYRYNFGRMNELSKTLRQFVFSQENASFLKKYYPIIHIQVMNNVLIRAKRNNQRLRIPEIRSIMKEEICDWEFFSNECCKVQKCFPVFSRVKGHLLSYRMYFEYKYYADGLYTSLILFYSFDWMIKAKQKLQSLSMNCFSKQQSYLF